MLLLVELGFQTKHMLESNPTTSECDFTWKYDLYRGNQIKMSSMAVIQHVW